ncbi:hypothetical protein PIROE2DRAFT_7857 [Piromyces sp. E2]|nr:hypothetical protein PIROE2DRAFT_7857 [Piromyces sp. E2]|eukprot:OUM65142.1 hypothetical protein PIROE2DRAFT_7857 [Piromyces sp. E2]
MKLVKPIKEKKINIDRKYKFNFSYKKVNNSKIYRCTHYKTDYKCKSFIILNDKNKIIKYYNNHNHLEEDYNATITQMMRTINKQYPSNIKTFDEIPGESKILKTVRDEDFMIFKNPNVVIFQYLFQEKIYSQYSEDIFVDGTFSTAPKFSYQVFITRNCIKEYNCFYTTSISILNNKKQANYEILLNEVNKNAFKYKNNVIISPIKFQCDFEKGISNAAKKFFLI